MMMAAATVAAGMVVMVMAAIMVMVITAAVTALVMVAAAGIGIICQSVSQESLHGLVCIAHNAAVDLDIRILQRKAGAAADAAANEHIHAKALQKASQGAMAAAVGVHHLGGNHFARLCGIDFKLGGVTKVLEHIAIFVGNCNFHNFSP